MTKRISFRMDARKLILVFLLLISILFVVVVFVHRNIERNAQFIAMEKRTKGKEGHIDSYEIRNQTTVKRIRKILHEADWSTCKAKPKTSPDYQFCFQFVSKNYEAKAVLYEVWILKNGDQLYIESGGYESTIIKQDLAAGLIDLLNH